MNLRVSSSHPHPSPKSHSALDPTHHHLHVKDKSSWTESCDSFLRASTLLAPPPPIRSHPLIFILCSGTFTLLQSCPQSINLTRGTLTLIIPLMEYSSLQRPLLSQKSLKRQNLVSNRILGMQDTFRRKSACSNSVCSYLSYVRWV